MLHDFLVAGNFRGCNFQDALLQLPPAEQEVRAFIQGHKNRMGRVFAGLLGAEPLAEEITLLLEGALISSQMIGNPTPVATARRLAGRLL